MSILFLDHDGVLCLEQNWGTRQKNGEDFDSFDIGAIKVLNDIIRTTDCRIVISSDWRHHLSLEQALQMYEKRGIISRCLIGFTPTKPTTNLSDLEAVRVLEIQEWLKQHNMEKAKYCAVDDMDLSALGDKQFIQCTHSREGIKQTGLKERIIKRLR